jgi:uncharacterized membrane protein
MILQVILVLLAALSYMVTGKYSVSVIFVLFYIIGNILVRLSNKDKFQKEALKVFRVTFFSFFVYALICFVYMEANNYQYLQSFDGHEVYIPYTKQLMPTDSFFELINKIYETSRYSFVGSILVLFVYVGKLSYMMDGELYVTIQISIMLFAALTSVVVYRIFLQHGMYAKAYRYTLIYSLLSIHFLMATYIVRDMPITLAYTIIIYLTFKPYAVKNILIIVGLILFIMTMRIASGIFPIVYLLIIIFFNKNKEISFTRIATSFAFFIILIIALYSYTSQFIDVFNQETEAYSDAEMEDQGGESTKAGFNNLPPVVSEFVKVGYNQVMSIPSWRKMLPTSFRPETHGAINFPEVYATLFRYVMWIVIIVGLFNRRIRTSIFSNRILLMNFIIAFVFLMLQSSTMGHRRMLGVYPVFFLIACLIYNAFNTENRKVILSFSVGVFIIVQMFGLIYIF